MSETVTASTAPHTNVVGYYNGNTWPLHISISEANLNFQLGPGQFLLDKAGRKINDPKLDVYAGPKMLSKETGKRALPIIPLPSIDVRTVNVSANPVGSKHRDGGGQWVNTPVTPGTASTGASKPTQGMTMEEARRRGFIGKQRIVPEDHGPADTASSTVAAPAEMAVSMESTPPALLGKNTDLPAPLLDPSLDATPPSTLGAPTVPMPVPDLDEAETPAARPVAQPRRPRTIYQCPRCAKRAPNTGLLRRHFEAQHAEEAAMLCEQMGIRLD